MGVLGIDVGSVSVSVAEVSYGGELIKSGYVFHHGDIAKRLTDVLGDFDLSRITAVAATTSTPPIIRAQKRFDGRISIIDASKKNHALLGSILIVGGEKFGAILFDENGDYLRFKANTSCAAGTGSFLDQQAKRLNLSGIEELSAMAFQNKGAIPKIASRCAVFAKTDLVHAQSEGYTLAEICDGLCFGLAKNIVDTLFTGQPLAPPIVFTGGVAKNRAVAKHISTLIGHEMALDENNVYGAFGAALNLIKEGLNEQTEISTVSDLIKKVSQAKKTHYPPLKLKKSHYPVFDSLESFEFNAQGSGLVSPVEVDIYEEFPAAEECRTYLGIDIGSTSTKAILMSEGQEVLAGFYIRTSGRPVAATQNILAAIDHVVEDKQVNLTILGVGTTGAGRKFIGKIVNADLIIDEITAHARAAYKLNPDVDTIIEIGGQDSKFTTLKDGMVTFSVMNNVCAAGTGSFIEEQAQKLDCPLSDFATLTENQKSPMTSDRCTVFMERDMNHYLMEGYRTEEVLASSLHAVRENYLTKTAVEGSIGRTVLFQGATAKNKALVAAFEQRLGQSIWVSKFCHLTGALGITLILAEMDISQSGFRGLGLHQKEILIRSEVCEICSNHCKLSIADLDGQVVAYGFLCGRDYDQKKFVNNNTSGFDLLKQRKKAFPTIKTLENESPVVGLPATLHLAEDIPYWEKFFNLLGIKTITSQKLLDAVRQGKYLAGAEFCAPMTAMYGHTGYLLDKSDFIFLPYYLEKKQTEKEKRRHYCYYTQYAPALASSVKTSLAQNFSTARFLMPLLHYLYEPSKAIKELTKAVNQIGYKKFSRLKVEAAYLSAFGLKTRAGEELKQIYKEQISDLKDGLHVVLLGRPYTVLSDDMNKQIPDIFGSMGIKTFYQDMLDYRHKDLESIQPLLREIHWLYASKILETAEAIGKSDGAYAVLITSFRCSPDSFVVDYFKSIMEAHKKPYLVLQLDEHDSSVGYETRIEAAVRSFKNHHQAKTTLAKVVHSPMVIPERVNKIDGKTLLFPNWGEPSLRLLVAALQNIGIDARLLKPAETSIQKSLRHNTGQCIPLNIIAQESIDYVEQNNLDPSRVVLWVMNGRIACNLRLIPHYIKTLFNLNGSGMEKAGVYAGDMSLVDISLKMPIPAYFAYFFGGTVRKIACDLRPFEKIKGQTNQVMAKSLDILEQAFLEGRDREPAATKVVELFKTIETKPGHKPKVAIFGDVYVRDNDLISQNLTAFIEENGGRVVTTPYSSFVKMVARPYFKKWFIEGEYKGVAFAKSLLKIVKRLERKYLRLFGELLPESYQVYDHDPAEILAEYNVRMENSGESMENILKIFYLLKAHPDLSLFVQASPAFCCPSLVTEGMAQEIERKTGVPVVSVTYDGTGGNKNEAIVPYLKYPRNSGNKTPIAAG